MTQVVGGMMSQMTYIPRIYEKVLVACHHYVFLVISVDQNKRTAELMELGEKVRVLESVPFSALRRFREDMPVEAAWSRKPGIDAAVNCEKIGGGR